MSDGPFEPLLASCVPELQLQSLSINFYNLFSKIQPNSCFCVHRKPAGTESKGKACFTNTRLSQDNDLETARLCQRLWSDGLDRYIGNDSLGSGFLCSVIVFQQSAGQFGLQFWLRGHPLL